MSIVLYQNQTNKKRSSEFWKFTTLGEGGMGNGVVSYKGRESDTATGGWPGFSRRNKMERSRLHTNGLTSAETAGQMTLGQKAQSPFSIPKALS